MKGVYCDFNRATKRIDQGGLRGTGIPEIFQMHYRYLQIFLQRYPELYAVKKYLCF